MHSRTPMSLSVLGVVLVAGAGQAATITVTTTRDVSDAASDAIGDLPGPDGVVSFREAVDASTANPGPDTIEFAVPEADWWLEDNIALLRLDRGAIFVDDDETTIDFSTQTAFTGDTNVDGAEVGLFGAQPNGAGTAAIFVNADHCVIKGLGYVWQRGYAVQIVGSHNRVIGCVIDGPVHAAVQIRGAYDGPPATGNIIGGTAPGEGNWLAGGNSGVRITYPAENNAVVGNHIRGGTNGVEVIGSPYTDPPVNNRVGGPTPAERNVIAGAGSYCCEGVPSGALVSVEYAQGTVVEGNYIGTTPDGSDGVVQRAPTGVEVRESTGTIVRNNVIADVIVGGANHHSGELFGVGVEVRGVNDDTLITGNIIGADATGQNPVPNLNGVWVQAFPSPDRPVNTVIENNLIAFNQRTGVYVQSTLTERVAISRNSIHSNGALGIELENAGVDANDPGDVDGVQNYPALSAVSGDEVVGSLSSAPNEVFRIEFFASDACDPSGNGEGEAYVGTLDVATDIGGGAAFVAVLDTPVTEGSFVTATATRLSTGDTSEFSACAQAGQAAECEGDTNGDHAVNFTDLNAVLADFGLSGSAYAGDCNADGVVNFQDLNAVLTNFGASCG